MHDPAVDLGTLWMLAGGVQKNCSVRRWRRDIVRRERDDDAIRGGSVLRALGAGCVPSEIIETRGGDGARRRIALGIRNIGMTEVPVRHLIDRQMRDEPVCGALRGGEELRSLRMAIRRRQPMNGPRLFPCPRRAV